MDYWVQKGGIKNTDFKIEWATELYTLKMVKMVKKKKNNELMREIKMIILNFDLIPVRNIHIIIS